jgi:hypothetical protein
MSPYLDENGDAFMISLGRLVLWALILVSLLVSIPLTTLLLWYIL